MHSSNHFLLEHPDQESQQTKISKTLLIECLQDNFSQQYQVSIPYESVARELDLGEVLHEIFFQILDPICQYQVFYFSAMSGYFQFGGIYPFTQRFILGEEFIPKEEIFIAFRKTAHMDGQTKGNASNSSEQQKQTKKKRRINDRTILQTLQKVSIWRSKCQEQKVTFQQAAKQIDIPKKTLDDYYALIRTGQELGFDFQKNFSQKIGVLRQFVRENQSKFSKQRQKKRPESKNKCDQQTFEKQKETQRKMSIIDKMILEDDSGNQE